MTAANGNNVTLTKDGTIVTIAVTDDEENLTKGLTIITEPKSPQQQSIVDGANESIIIDILMKAEQRITIDGDLVTGIGDTDTHNDAEGKKADLKSIFLAGGVFNMTYEGETITANSDKLSIKRYNTDGQLPNDGESEFSVKMTMIRGKPYTS